jgi:hypothetical protein
VKGFYNQRQIFLSQFFANRFYFCLRKQDKKIYFCLRKQDKKKRKKLIKIQTSFCIQKVDGDSSAGLTSSFEGLAGVVFNSRYFDTNVNPCPVC